MEEFFIGIDDAGRGPVIGPMVLAGIFIKKEDIKDLKILGVKDSKLIAPKKRNQIFNELISKYSHHFELCSPEEIDNFPNLNHLEAIKVGIIINKFLEEMKKKKIKTDDVKIIVDCPSINTRSWRDYLLNTLNDKKVKLLCEHKADFNYPVVGAASIIAKENREKEVEILKKKIGDFGSGYPSDPKTIEFLKNNLELLRKGKFLREKWGTVKNLEQKKSEKTKQKSLF
jgi:ribonuclease HII